MPVTLDDLARRILALERANEERASEERRLGDGRRHEYDAMIAAAQRAVQKTIELGMAPLLSLNNEQLVLLKESQEERMLQRAKERIEAEEKQREKEAEAKQEKADANARARKSEVEANEVILRAAKDADRKHRLAIWGVILGMLTIVGSLITAAIASHK